MLFTIEEGSHGFKVFVFLQCVRTRTTNLTFLVNLTSVDAFGTIDPALHVLNCTKNDGMIDRLTLLEIALIPLPLEPLEPISLDVDTVFLPIVFIFIAPGHI